MATSYVHKSGLLHMLGVEEPVASNARPPVAADHFELGAITIPATSRERYLGGTAALNLPSATGTGDWHMMQTFFRPRQTRSRSFISGAGCATNTNHLLGERGVFDCSALLRELHIPFEGEAAYAADHARAIADLVFGAVLRGESPDFVVLDDWMPRNSDKELVFDLMAGALDKISPGERTTIRAWQGKSRSSR